VRSLEPRDVLAVAAARAQREQRMEEWKAEHAEAGSRDE